MAGHWDSQVADPRSFDSGEEMPMTDDFEIRKKIENLEAQNRRLKLTGMALCLLLSAALLLSWVATIRKGVLTANEFVLKDRSGRVLARLGSDGSETCFQLMGEANGATASLCAGDEVGTSLMLDNRRSQSRAFLSAGTKLREGPGTILPGIVITHSNGKDVISATVGDESEFLVGQEDGEHSIILSSGKTKPSISLFGVSQSPLWKTP